MVQNSLCQETERNQRVATDRGPHQPQLAADQQTPEPIEKNVLDADENFREEDLYLDLGVGD